MSRRRDERGFTLTELSVVMLIGSIVTFIGLNFLDNTSLVVSRSSARVRTEADARLAMRAVLQDIRAAQNIATTYPSTATCPSATTYPSGYASCLRFSVLHTTAAGAACPYSQITYGVNGGVLREDRVDYDVNCVAKTVLTGKVILKDVTNAARPLFTYADQYGNRLSTSTSTAAQFAAAGTVNVQLYLQFQTRAPEMSIFSAAALRNNR